jgi:hypothetical protein
MVGRVGHQDVQDWIVGQHVEGLERRLKVVVRWEATKVEVSKGDLSASLK